MLHWILDLPKLLAEIKRVLKPQGVFVFSYYGPDTLREMGEPWSPFIDMHDVGDALVNAGFRDPIVDMERLNIEYDSFKDAKADLLNTADNELVNLSESRSLKLITYEMIYGHAWLESHTFTADKHGQVSIPLHSLRKRK
jgi:malonyl-CoA O-methyltransferase